MSLGFWRLALYLSIAFSVALANGAAQADRSIGEFQGINISLADEFSCGERAKVKMSADDPSPYSDEALLDRLVGAVRTMLEFECETIRDVMLEGYAGTELVYRAVTSESSGWEIMTVIAPQAPDTRPETVVAEPEVSPVAPAPSPETESFLPELPDQAGGSEKADPVAVIDQGFTTIPPDPAASSPDRQVAPRNVSPDRTWDELAETARKGSFPTEGYNFPVLMSRIYFGELSNIPDDEKSRSIVVSVMTALNRNCGERPANVALAALRYGSKQMREMDQNPGKIVEHTLGPLANMIKGFESGGVFAGLEALTSGGMIVTEGVQDGEEFIRGHGCNGKIFRQFVYNMDKLILARASQNPAPEDDVIFSTLMSPALRERLGYPDPAVALRERQLKEFETAANASCVKQYDSQPFCECMVGKIKSMSFEDDDWRRVGSDFTALAKLSVSYDAVLPGVRSCID